MTIQKLASQLQRFAEFVLAALLGLMFAAFVIQIVFRYFFNLPTGWTTEITLITWLWLVLWGTVLVNSESEEIRIDLLTSAVGERTRRVMAILAVGANFVLYAISLPAAYAYVSFMKVEKSAYLKIPMSWLYSIFIIFVIATLIRSLWIMWNLAHGKKPEASDPAKVTSAL